MSARIGVAVLIAIGVCAALVGVGVWWRWPLIIAFALPVAGCLWPRRSEPATGNWQLTTLFAAATLVLLTGYAIYATNAPPPEFDFLADWGAKGRAFWEARSIDWRFLETATYRATHPDYPLLVPFAFDAVAVLRGSWDERFLGLVNVVFAAALLLVVHGTALAELKRRDAAAFVALALVPFACSPWIGLADGPLAAYATAGLLLVRRGSVTVGGVLLGLGAMTKNEGLTFIAAAAIALVIARRAREVLRLWPAVAIPLPWLVLRRVHGLGTDLTEGNVFARAVEHLRDPRPLVSAFAQYAHVGKPWFWLALAIGAAIAIRPLVKRERFVLAALGVQLLCYLAAYVATPHDLDWHVRWSWERLISHLTPSLTFVVLVSLLSLDESG